MRHATSPVPQYHLAPCALLAAAGARFGAGGKWAAAVLLEAERRRAAGQRNP